MARPACGFLTEKGPCEEEAVALLLTPSLAPSHYLPCCARHAAEEPWNVASRYEPGPR